MNGGALFASFEVSAHPTLCWFASRNRLAETGFPGWFLGSPQLGAALPELAETTELPDPGRLGWGYGFTLDGELASALVGGGAYAAFEGTAAEAKELGARFARALYGDRFTEVLVYRWNEPWSTWFYGIAWDSTWTVVDKRSRRISILAVTDVD